MARAFGSYPECRRFKSHCRYQAEAKCFGFTWPGGQAVKTPPFHGGNTSSILVRVTTIKSTQQCALYFLCNHEESDSGEFSACLFSLPWYLIQMNKKIIKPAEKLLNTSLRALIYINYLTVIPNRACSQVIRVVKKVDTALITFSKKDCSRMVKLTLAVPE